MSHGDHVDEPPPGYRRSAATPSLPVAAFRRDDRPIYGVQFHPEVAHTPRGERDPLELPLPDLRLRADVDARAVHRGGGRADPRRRSGDARVICGLSGGVDSSVAAALVHRAIGDRLTCIFVDTGLAAEGRAREVERTFRRHLGIRLVVVDAAEQFLERLRGRGGPGGEAASASARRSSASSSAAAPEAGAGSRFLVQGTLYPDVIESLSVQRPVGRRSRRTTTWAGCPEDMPFELVEPLRELFKDEVRQVGRELGLPEELVGRHPFPGPGPRDPGARRGDRGAAGDPARGRRDLPRGDPRGRSLRRHLAGVRGAAAGAERRRDGRRRAPTRTWRRCARSRAATG